jgi:glycosyltransferase involved in cell wall biosynthesis
MHTTKDFPLVSVLIPTHNRKDKLINAVSSVLQQTIQSFEVFILDDASTEDLAEVAQQFNDLRIIHHRKEEKSNANVMRNIGLRIARGQYIAFLDSDDEWLSNHLETKLSLLTKLNVDGVFGSCFIDDGFERKYTASKPLEHGNHPVNYLLSDGFAPIPSWVLKASSAKNLSFDETLKRHQDYDYFIRFSNLHKWVADWEPTLIVHWQLGAVRNFDFNSERIFIQKYASHIERRILCQYSYKHYHQWKTLKNKEAYTHYKKLMIRHIDFVTFNQFNQLQVTQQRFLFPIRWLTYSFLLVAKHFRRIA